jgi:hypothetical protein
MGNLTFPIVPDPQRPLIKNDLQFPIFGVIPVSKKPSKAKVEVDSDKSDSV